MNYQEKVCTRADVHGLYEKVLKNPAIEKYRGYTETKSYGWDEKTGDYIKCDGEVWFDNPGYDATFVPEGECNSASAELLDEQLAAREEELRGMRAEHEELCRVIDTLNAKLTEAENTAGALTGERDRVSAELSELRGAFSVIRRWITAESEA